jgi:hypothetical protein
LNQTADGLAESVEYRTSIFEVFLFTLNDHRSRVYKKSDDYWDDNTYGRQEENIDLTDIGKGNDCCSRPFEHVYDCERERVVKNTEVAGELVEQHTRGSDVKELAGTADDAVDHFLVYFLVGHEDGNAEAIVFDDQ